MPPLRIPFRRPVRCGNELAHLAACVQQARLCGGGEYSQRCEAWLTKRYGSARVLLTQSCTSALEIAAILARVEPGDEVILPSYTFPSVANAFVLRGARPVFVDVDPETLCITPKHIDAALGDRTRAIVAVHFGHGCEIEALVAQADAHGLVLVEDCALAFDTDRHARPLGSFAPLGTLSFHDTKDVVAGEGGALLINDPALVERAEYIYEKGTDRLRFARHEVPRYSWCDVGGSHAPSELVAAFLYAQLEASAALRMRRGELVARYRRGLATLVDQGVAMPAADGNVHLLCLVLRDDGERDRLAAWLRARGIESARHYVPLHSTRYGQEVGRCATTMEVTDRLDRRLLRLPLYPALLDEEVDEVVAALLDFFASRATAG